MLKEDLSMDEILFLEKVELVLMNLQVYYEDLPWLDIRNFAYFRDRSMIDISDDAGKHRFRAYDLTKGDDALAIFSEEYFRLNEEPIAGSERLLDMGLERDVAGRESVGWYLAVDNYTLALRSEGFNGKVD